MRYILLFTVFFSFSASAQMKEDTNKPTLAEVQDSSIYYWGRNKSHTIPNFDDVVFLMQKNKELSDRLDQLEIDLEKTKGDIEGKLYGYKIMIQIIIHALDSANKRYWKLKESYDSLERRPYLFIDNKGVRPGLILTNSVGEYQIFIAPLNYK